MSILKDDAQFLRECLIYFWDTSESNKTDEEQMIARSTQPRGGKRGD